MSEERTIWVSCDGSGLGDIDLWTHEPVWCEEDETFYSLGGPTHIGWFEENEIEALFGIKIRPGQCLKIKLTAEVLEGNDGNGN